MAVVVERAGADLATALELQCRAIAPEERRARVQHLKASHAAGVVSLEDCLVVRRRQQIVGVLLLVRQTDRTVYVWPAVVSTGLPPDDQTVCLEALYAEAVRRVDASDAWIAQTLLDQSELEQSRELDAHGFPRLTELQFLHRPLDRPLPPLPDDRNVALRSATPAPSADRSRAQPGIESDQFISFDGNDATANRFAAVLEQSYEGTLDCPELNGHRTGHDALQGHRLTGRFVPERWLLMNSHGLDAGLLLLNEHAAENVWEVVYMGIVPAARGRGAGRRLLLRGLHLARQSGALEVVLAVDIRNGPALKLYRDLGFEAFDQRIVHIRLPARS